MIEFIVFLLVVGNAFANSESCIPAMVNGNEVERCVIFKQGLIYDINVTECANYHEHCCIYNEKCVRKRTRNEAQPRNLWGLRSAFLREARDKIQNADARLLATFLSEVPSRYHPPVPFPAICKVTRYEPYVIDPPVSVPYCVRIPCRQKNAPLDKDLKSCCSKAGCYFDEALFEHREAFGPSVLAGVPVCHLAIRNSFFQKKALDVVNKHGSWNPHLTNCLLTRYDEQIRKGPDGCDLLPILAAFSVAPKLAGWETINSYECALIDGCWRPGRACFYPVDMKQVRLNSEQREVTPQKNQSVYGRLRCQVFDTTSDLNILKSYHRCLSSGCDVDSSVSDLYYNHLYSLGEYLTSENHWKFWSDVEQGLVGAYNIEAILTNYGFDYDSTHPKPTTLSATSQPLDPFAGDIFGGPFPFGDPPSRADSSGCGDSYRVYGGRPCKPPNFTSGKSNKICPYKPFFVPRFPKLNGKFDGCCDINLCYMSKVEILKMHSGPSHYYTEWSSYSECSKTCGQGGLKKRFRTCISGDRSKCTKKLVDVKPCFIMKCCAWATWSSYTPCPNSCYPGGIQTRTRKCLSEAGHCDGSGEETRECNRQKPCWG